MDIQEQRVRFVVSAARGTQRFSSLCAEFGISRPTGYLWLRRYQELGVRGIAERSRKPHRSPRRTADSLEQRVVEVRLRYPDWGARKLSVILAREGVVLPRNTIHRILLRHDLIRETDQHPPALPRFERTHPNECWQIDFIDPTRGPQPSSPSPLLSDPPRHV